MRIPIDKLPLRDVVTLPGGVPDTTTEAATATNAQFLWRAAHAHAQRKGRPMIHESVPGREMTINMAKVILDQAFLGLTKNQDSLDARKALYDFLRDTRNMKCLQSLGPATGGVWWVADEWNAARRGKPAPGEGALSRFEERRVQPKDAGEHRDPSPVIAGYRCTVAGCPDTQTFPHRGALDEHIATSHPLPAFTSETILALTPDDITAAKDAADEITRMTEGPEWQEQRAEAAPVPEFSQEAIARRVFDAVQASGLTQGKIGEALGLHGSSVSSMITGRQRISVEQIFRIAQITGTTVQNLLGLPTHKAITLYEEIHGSLLPSSAPLVVSEIPTSELLSVLASRVEAAEAEVRSLRAAASDSDRDDLVAELKEEIAMHVREKDAMRAENHRARKLMGRE